MTYQILNAVFHGFVVFALLRILTALYPGKKTQEFEVQAVRYGDTEEYTEAVQLMVASGWEVSALALCPGKYGGTNYAVIYKRSKQK